MNCGRVDGGRSEPRPYSGEKQRVVGRGWRLRLGVGEGAGGVDGDAAVDEQGLAGDVTAGFGGEEDDGAVEVVGVGRGV